MVVFKGRKDNGRHSFIHLDYAAGGIPPFGSSYLTECGVLDVICLLPGSTTTFSEASEIDSTLLFAYPLLGVTGNIIVINMQEVKFSLNPDLSIFENGFSEDAVAQTAELTKERLGYFERWGDKIVVQNENSLQMTVGIVIDAETGKVYEVIPRGITFPPNHAAAF